MLEPLIVGECTVGPLPFGSSHMEYLWGLDTLEIAICGLGTYVIYRRHNRINLEVGGGMLVSRHSKALALEGGHVLTSWFLAEIVIFNVPVIKLSGSIWSIVSMNYVVPFLGSLYEGAYLFGSMLRGHLICLTTRTSQGKELEAERIGDFGCSGTCTF